MKIQSVLIEDEIVLFEETLSSYSKDTLVQKQIKKCKKGTFIADCCLKLSCDLCVIKTQFDLQKLVTDQFGVEGDFVQVSCLLKGESQLMGVDMERELKLGKVFLCSQAQPAETIKMPPVCTKYICILISRAFYLNLLKSESWAREDRFYQDVKNNKSVPFGTLGIPLEFQLYQVLMDMVGCNWTLDKQMNYVQLKVKELFLQLHYQLQA